MSQSFVPPVNVVYKSINHIFAKSLLATRASSPVIASRQTWKEPVGAVSTRSIHFFPGSLVDSWLCRTRVPPSSLCLPSQTRVNSTVQLGGPNPYRSMGAWEINDS